jgi:hypothetical protein
MTQQERAAVLLDRIIGIIPIQPSQREARIEWLVEYAVETRRAALLEAAEEIERFIDYSGGCVGTENDPRVVAVNRFITISIVPLLNRLAQEG